MTTKNQSTNETNIDSHFDDQRAVRAGEERESVAVPSNTATNNSNNEDYSVKFLRFGVDSLYLSYQGNIHQHIDLQLASLKKLAQSEHLDQQAKAQLKVVDHLFEIKDKGTSMFAYVLEDNAFRIQLSRPNKSVPMAYIKISSEYLTHKLPAEAEKHLHQILSELGVIESSANVSRIDLFVDFVSHQNMEAWTREAWVTRASSVTAYAIDNHFTGWAIGLGGAIAARLYDKLYEVTSSNKGYLVPLWQAAGGIVGEPIWRLEFEFKRDFLKQKSLVTLKDVLANLNGLWSYATTEWLKLTIPNPCDDTRSRWLIHPLWQALSSLDWETDGGELQPRFSNSRVPSKDIALHRAFTGLITFMAIEGQNDYELAIHPFFEALSHYINNLAINLGHSFESLINEKVALKAKAFNTMDVNNEIYEDTPDDDAEAYRKASDGE